MILEEPLSTDVYTAINNRRAIREYTTEPIAQEVLDRVVSAALEAPSAFNLQLRDVVVVRDPQAGSPRRHQVQPPRAQRTQAQYPPPQTGAVGRNPSTPA